MDHRQASATGVAVPGVRLGAGSAILSAPFLVYLGLSGVAFDPGRIGWHGALAASVPVRARPQGPLLPDTP
jgi:hypothetical protein